MPKRERKSAHPAKSCKRSGGSARSSAATSTAVTSSGVAAVFCAARARSTASARNAAARRRYSRVGDMGTDTTSGGIVACGASEGVGCDRPSKSSTDTPKISASRSKISAVGTTVPLSYFEIADFCIFSNFPSSSCVYPRSSRRRRRFFSGGIDGDSCIRLTALTALRAGDDELDVVQGLLPLSLRQRAEEIGDAARGRIE